MHQIRNGYPDDQLSTYFYIKKIIMKHNSQKQTTQSQFTHISKNTREHRTQKHQTSPLTQKKSFENPPWKSPRAPKGPKPGRNDTKTDEPLAKTQIDPDIKDTRHIINERILREYVVRCSRAYVPGSFCVMRVYAARNLSLQRIMLSCPDLKLPVTGLK